jgi:adenosylcobinamide-GDP ribazoletransferase
VRAAFVFLTRLPVGGFPYEKEHFAWAPAHFPLVGVVVGALSAGLLWILQPLGPWVAASFALLGSVYATGAFHEDGLADTADALGGAHSSKKIHDILKDSRIGTYGACAVVLSLLLRCALLAELQISGLSLALVCWMAVHGLSRVGPVMLMAVLPYVAGEGAKGSVVAQGGQRSRAVVACLWGGLILLGAALLRIPASVLVAWCGALLLVTFLAGRTFLRRAGGYTGDFLGATEQVTEISLLAVGLWVMRA